MSFFISWRFPVFWQINAIIEDAISAGFINQTQFSQIFVNNNQYYTPGPPLTGHQIFNQYYDSCPVDASLTR